jgi:hypothetical protein
MGKDNKSKRYHNKKRNAALLYEFLIRHISSCLVSNKQEEAKIALAISKKYFAKGTILNEELKLVNTLVKNKMKSKESAHRLVSEVLSLSKKVDSRKLDVEKSLLIKEINHNFGMDTVYNYKVPNYTVYASINNLLTDNINKKSRLSLVDRIKFEDSIVEHLTKEVVTQSKTPDLKSNPKYNNLVYKFIVERFHKKYENKLSVNQKKLITDYALYLVSNDKDKFVNEVKSQFSTIAKKLSNVKDKTLVENKDLMTKINECSSKLATVDVDSVTEVGVVNILKYIQLSEEVDS